MQDDLLPSLSVVIPTRNRVAELRACLEALAQAAVPGMECIVVDDASSVDIAPLLLDLPYPVKLIRNPNCTGSGVARNVGAYAARGSILLFVDDDVCVQSGSLAAVVSAFESDPGLGALIGRYDDAPSSPDFLSQFRNLLHAYTHRISAGPASTFWTGFGAVRSAIFREHGGFTDQAYAIDDVEFGTRLAEAGVRIELRPDLQVKHLKRWTLKCMVKTDILLRGVPWTLLLWRSRRLPNTLNLRRGNRWSVMLALLAVLLAAASVFGHLHWSIPALCAAIVLAINANFYNFLRHHHGKRFALKSVPAHWLHLWIAGISFAVGTSIFFTRILRSREQTPDVDTSIALPEAN